MTAPLPSPAAGLFDALVRLNIRRLTARIAELRQLIAAETEIGHQLRTRAGYRDTDAAGYIDRSFLE